MKTFKILLSVITVLVFSTGLFSQNPHRQSGDLHQLFTKIDSLRGVIESKETDLATLEALLEAGLEIRVYDLPPVSNPPRIVDVATPGNQPQTSFALQTDPHPSRASEASAGFTTQVGTVARPTSQRKFASQPVTTSTVATVSVPITETVNPAPASSAQRSVLEPKDVPDNWQCLRTGMTQKQVRKLLGEPDRISDRVIIYWNYFTSMGDKGVVYFDGERVTGWNEPYFDPAGLD